MNQPLPPLLPLPRQVNTAAGPGLPVDVRLEPRLTGVDTPRLAQAVEAWRRVQPPAGGPGLPLEIHCARASAAHPALDDDEHYRLEVSAAGVRLEAPEEWGVLRGLATVAQLHPSAAGLPPLVIDDAPRFRWRGLMLDPARRFLPLSTLLRTVDAMAAFKLNVLHLHLSDDQGFRFPSRTHPELASGCCYARGELEQLVAHASARGVRIVPELDMPGHTASWLAAHPEWGSGNAQPSRRFGVHRECLDPTREPVYQAIEALLAELAEVFPDAFLHIGGDEVHPAWWSASAAIQRFMAREGIADGAALQAYFSGRVVRMVQALGRRPMAWDEALHPQLSSAVTVQAWRGVTARDRARRLGFDCVLSAPYYLDLAFPADLHYGFDPDAAEDQLCAREDALGQDPRLRHVAAGMAWTRHWREPPSWDDGGAARRPGRLLGAEACLWSELVDEHTLEVRLWSRLPALAERFWSAAEVTDADDMARRMDAVLARLGSVLDIEPTARSRALLARAGVSDAWLPLTDALEPVKWYARLLGEEALAARLSGREMPQSRPYQADTPLHRAVDALPPESAAGREVAELLTALDRPGARERLLALAEGWRRLPLASAGPVELEPLAERLVLLGGRLPELLHGDPTARAWLDQAAQPVGEYLLAPAVALQHWLERRSAP